METISFNKSSLFEFINSEKYSNLKNIPINVQRAISQIHNPRIGEEDIILVAQFDKDITTGYLGILPDYVVVDGKKERMGWLTCFWVHEKYKSKDVAANLFRRVIRAWEQKIFITNIVPWLEPIYQKTKLFKPTIYKEGFRGYLRFNFTEILPPKSTIFRKLKFFLKVTDRFLNLFANLRFILFRKYLITLKFEYILHLDDSIGEFIAKHNKVFWNSRGKEDIDWILHYPWIIEGAKEDFNSSRYFFSSMSKRFIYQLVKFSDSSDKIVAIIWINIRNNNITVPYIFAEKFIIDEISRFLINTMIDQNLNMITTFNEDLVSSLNRIKHKFIFKKTIKKPYFISKKFETIETLNFQDGDGDCAFY